MNKESHLCIITVAPLFKTVSCARGESPREYRSCRASKRGEGPGCYMSPPPTHLSTNHKRVFFINRIIIIIIIITPFKLFLFFPFIISFVKILS